MREGAALVTGGARRLGREMALALASRGHDIALHFSGSADDAAATAEDISAQGVRVELLQADLTVESEMQALVARATGALQKSLSVLINNASVFEHDTLAGATRDSWDRHLESNLRAPFVLTQHFAAQAQEPEIDGRGEAMARSAIINMTDQRVRKLTPEFMSYTLAKSALWALTQTAARALAPRVRVNAIGPGPTLKAEQQSERHFSSQRAATIMGRGSNPEDIVSAMTYLLDAPAVTGQMICVDGGQHLGWQTPDVIGTQ
ncbi:MAG: SDR family oxidoreductase [Paracoccaceae bacterium]